MDNTYSMPSLCVQQRESEIKQYKVIIWCNFRKSCMQRLRVAYNFGCRALYNLPWRASVSSHQVQCNIPTFETLLRKYKYLFLERCRKPNHVWLRALMQSDCLYSSLVFEHYNRITLWTSDRTLQCPFDRWRVKPQCLRILPRLAQFRN